MKKILASFHEPGNNESFYNLPISRQTFQGSGALANINFTINNNLADWHIIGTWTQNIEGLENKKLIYIQQEPPNIKYPSKQILDKCKVALTFFYLDHNIPQEIIPPALQWTYDIKAKSVEGIGHVYEKNSNNSLDDILFAPVPKKVKKCSIIVSSKTMTVGHKNRIVFLNELKNNFKDEIDIFGFGFNPIENKKDAIDPYAYSIAIENIAMNNYWTEKIADVFLGYTCPIYHGCSNIQDFFDPSSLISFNCVNIEESLKIIRTALDNMQIINMEKIVESRRRILLDYNMLVLLVNAINKYEAII